MNELLDDMSMHFGYKELHCNMYIEDDIIVINLEYPSEDSYLLFIEELESYYDNSSFDIGEYIIDGDYEGNITIETE